MCAAGTRRDTEDFGLSEVSAFSKQWSRCSPSFFKPQGSLRRLLPLLLCSQRPTSFMRWFLISKNSVCSEIALKNKRQEMRVEDGSGAVCCVQAEAFEFSCWESECIHSFRPEQSRNGEKGTIWTRSLRSGRLPLSCSCAITFFRSFVDRTTSNGGQKR